MNQTSDSDLLDKLKAVMELESNLTRVLEQVEPWLPSKSYQPNKNKRLMKPRVRPIPQNMEQAQHVLAVARSMAARTSAPAGWNKNSPVAGFSTPSPLPHQIRGGALAALQLERARQAERDKKRQRMQLQQKREEEQQKHEAEQGDVEMSEASEQRLDPKRVEVEQHEKDIQRSKSDLERTDGSRQPAKRPGPSPQQKKPVVDVSMNLSDSSSDDEED